MTNKIRNFISKLYIKQFTSFWILVVVPVLALIINIILSEAQNSVGFLNVIISIVFLTLLMIEITIFFLKICC